MGSKTPELFSKSDLLATLAILATARGSVEGVLMGMQRVMLNSPEAMRECTLPAGSKRVALTEAMLRAQTPHGAKYARCIICGEPVSDSKGSNHPAFPTLMLLLPSTLWTNEDVAGWDKGTAHRLGYVPGNVAIACLACNQWNTVHVKSGDAPMHTADTLMEPDAVLTSWEGIGYARKSDTESSDAAESRERREAARIRRGYLD